MKLEVKLSAGGSFVAADEVRAGAEAAGLDGPTTSALIENYEDAQLKALKTAFLAQGATALWASPADTAAFRRNDEKKLAPIITASGAKVN